MDQNNIIQNNVASEMLNIQDIINILKRRKALIIKAIIVAVFLAIVFQMSQPAKFTATAQLQINVRDQNVVDIKSVMSGVSSDSAAISSELDIIKSRRVMSQVVDKLKLINDEEFSSKSSVKSLIFDYIKSAINSFKSEEEISKEGKQKASRKKMALVDTLLGNLKVKQKIKSYTIYVSFTSEYPDKAALIANAVVDEYLLNQMKVKFDATKRANNWLDKKTRDLKSKVRESELLVQVFRKENNLIETAGVKITDQQLSELNSQLILARADRAQKEARMENSRKNIGSISDVLNSRLVQDLRAQEAIVLRKKSDLSSKYGRRHPEMINVVNEMKALQEKISLEEGKILSSLENEVEVAKNKELSLEKSLISLKKESGHSSYAQVKLDELIRQRDVNRALYESFLTRFKETAQDQTLNNADARIIGRAESPLYKSSPSSKIVVLIAIILGAGLGVVLAFLFEHLDNSFRSSEQIERETNFTSIGMTPQLENPSAAIKYVCKEFSSIYCESLRSVLTSVHFSNPDNTPKTIMVTSSTPKEGKSTFAATLAAVNAKSGSKVLIVDCDMRKPKVAKTFKQDIKHSIADVIAGDVPLKDALLKDKESGVHFIGASSNTHNSQDLLNSKKMEDFVKSASQEYDLVIFDTPPVLALADPLILSKIVDTTVFVVRWGTTPKSVVKTALKQVEACNMKVAGIVLSQVNLEKHKDYGFADAGYYYGTYKDYYNS